MSKSNNKITVDEILQSAEPRTKMSAQTEQELYDTLHKEWQSGLKNRRNKHWMYGLAASLLAGVFALIAATQIDRSIAPVPLVAKIETKYVHTQKTDLLNIKQQLFEGAALETGEGERYVVVLVGGGKLRINQNTMLKFITKQQVHLDRGSIYYDSDDHVDKLLESVTPKNTILIHTSQGKLSNYGTQFLVDNTDQSVTVSVRSGQIKLETPSLIHSVEAGQKLVVVDEKVIERDNINAYGETWSWVERTSPSFKLNNAPMSALLRWVSQETGREIEYSSYQAEELANTSLLVGTVDKLPLEALDIWMATIEDLEAQSMDGKIVVSVRSRTSE